MRLVLLVEEAAAALGELIPLVAALGRQDEARLEESLRNEVVSIHVPNLQFRSRTFRT